VISRKLKHAVQYAFADELVCSNNLRHRVAMVTGKQWMKTLAIIISASISSFEKMLARKCFKKLSRLYLDKRKADLDAKNDCFTFNPFLTSPGRRRWQQQCIANSENISHGSDSYFMYCMHQLCKSFTARSMLRSKEVSMRKIIGAARGTLFLQFIIESVLLFLFASDFH
jgi:hypothetical protein